MKTILLCSGGLDSMVIYNEMKSEISECVYIKYRGDHPATLRELELLNEEGVNPTVIEISDLKEDKRGFYFGRNLKFLLAVREKYSEEDISVLVGNTANDGFSDNTRMFFYKVEEVINSSYPHTIRIVCPLENRTKASLLKEAKKKKIKFYFCDKGERIPCGVCHSCKAMKDAGYFDEEVEKE